jgi:hypothetical protein
MFKNIPQFVVRTLLLTKIIVQLPASIAKVTWKLCTPVLCGQTYTRCPERGHYKHSKMSSRCCLLQKGFAKASLCHPRSQLPQPKTQFTVYLDPFRKLRERALCGRPHVRLMQPMQVAHIAISDRRWGWPASMATPQGRRTPRAQDKTWQIRTVPQDGDGTAFWSRLCKSGLHQHSREGPGLHHRAPQGCASLKTSTNILHHPYNYVHIFRWYLKSPTWINMGHLKTGHRSALVLDTMSKNDHLLPPQMNGNLLRSFCL